MTDNENRKTPDTNEEKNNQRTIVRRRPAAKKTEAAEKTVKAEKREKAKRPSAGPAAKGIRPAAKQEQDGQTAAQKSTRRKPAAPAKKAAQTAPAQQNPAARPARPQQVRKPAAHPQTGRRRVTPPASMQADKPFISQSLQLVGKKPPTLRSRASEHPSRATLRMIPLGGMCEIG
ncbi:MAG: hypothetical protein ACI4MM_09160, partial [Candidatus Ventricola sp.]